MVENDLFERLKTFIIKHTFVIDVEITLDTKIESEFGITGDDVDNFIIAFSKEFNVDISEFKVARYFKGEGDTILISIINFLLGKKTEGRYPPLTVGDLERAIKKGKLDETVIGKK